MGRPIAMSQDWRLRKKAACGALSANILKNRLKIGFLRVRQDY